MSGRVIVGAQWGDEGKGKFIDIFASEADTVVRSQGGNNAGHTVCVGEEVYKLHVVPSGILYSGTDNLIGPGVVVDPKVVLGEIEGLRSRGVSVDRLYIDARAHVIMPWHIELDGLSEAARGKSDIGTTKKGIGPCYMDKSERSGLRMHDFVNAESFESRIRELGASKNKIITALYGGDPLNIDAIIAEYRGYADALRPFVADTTVMLYETLKAGKKVLFEGAQGTLLDLDMGTYPYVTSSHPVAGGAAIGSGVGPTFIDECYGIAKAYTTRVGKGPFPTELDDDTGEYIRLAGGEYGTTTGRARRCGWFDAVIVRYAVRTNGLTSLVINKIDPLRGLPELKICTAYKKGGRLITDFPADFSELEGCEPVYETFPGFTEDISAARSFGELPETVRNYIDAVEAACGCTVAIVGVGPGRDQIIHRGA